jgi:hypothetical protein
MAPQSSGLPQLKRFRTTVEMTWKPTRRILIILVATLAMATILLFLKAPSRPPISIRVVTYGKQSLNRSTWAHIEITNSGAMIFDKSVTLSGAAQLRVELPTGFKTNDIGMLAPPSLPSRSTTMANVLLPPQTLRWQVGYEVQPVSFREWAMTSLNSKGQKRVNPILTRVPTNQITADWWIWSDLFEMPHSEIPNKPKD